MTTLRELYSEEPYAVVLYDDDLSSRCSKCFSAAQMPCPSGCGAIFYCSTSCASDDQPLHQYECKGYQERAKYSPESPVGPCLRLMGRVAARLRLDNGVAAVCHGLPEGVKSRTLSDLKRVPVGSGKIRKKNKLRGFVEQYLRFFFHTPLNKTKKKEVYRLAHVINNNMVSARKESIEASGLLLYLNLWRFRHNCVLPDLNFDLEGGSSWRTVVDLIIRGDKNEASRGRLDTQKRLDRLTVDHTRSLGFDKNGYLTLTRDRRKVLAENYINCRCVKCRDPKVMDFEENAAIVECDTCNRPYVWLQDTSQAKPSCRCTKTRKCLDGDQGKIRLELQLLNIQYQEVMIRMNQSPDPDRAILQCESLLVLAERYWHPLANLRLAQLYNKIFISYRKKMSLVPQLKPDAYKGYEVAWADIGVRMGESMLAIFEYHRCMEHHDKTYGTICFQIALFCHVTGDRDRLLRWLLKARTTFELTRDAKMLARIQELANAVKES